MLIFFFLFFAEDQCCPHILNRPTVKYPNPYFVDMRAQAAADFVLAFGDGDAQEKKDMEEEGRDVEQEGFDTGVVGMRRRFWRRG